MHFSKTYSELLITLPPEIRNNPFEYRKLKKLINQTASELDSLGLGPSVLRSSRERRYSSDTTAHLQEQDDTSTHPLDSSNVSEEVSDESIHHTIVYDVALKSSVLESRLRVSSSRHLSDAERTHSTQLIYHVNLPISEQSLADITRALFHPPITFEDDMHPLHSPDHHPDDLIIPLPSNAAFFQLLKSTLSSLSGHLDNLHDHFNSTLARLAASISSTALPVSSSAPHSFSAYSLTVDNTISLRPHLGGKSDLYIWREIFRLYAETEVFESVRKSTLGERNVEEVEGQLRLFEERIQEKRSSLVLSESRKALDVFLNLNLFILNLRKFQLANSEATRKILKKHVKRTTLPIPSYLLERYLSTSAASGQLALISHPPRALPRLLVQAIGEVLLPIVPHIDDYSCPICTAIAFKPIRLSCGHFFCLRCLVKMQRRGMANCPMCRAPTVLQANRSNVDYGLLNFIVDWFPIESREKQRVSEEEVIQEHLQNLGISDARGCRIM